GDRIACGRDRHHLDRLVRLCEPTCRDARARTDPVVAGVDPVDDVGVRYDAARTVCAYTGDGASAYLVPQTTDLHRSAPSSSMVSSEPVWSEPGRASACRSTNSRAASTSSGVLSVNVSTPFMARLAMPARVPAGGSSSMPVTPRSSIVFMHRSQRTGLETCATIRSRTSRPPWTTVPSRLEMTLTRGSAVAIEEARSARWSTAG